MEFFLKDRDVAEGEIPNPEAWRRPQGGDGIRADQKPKQVMVDELGYREKHGFAVIHIDVFFAPIIQTEVDVILCSVASRIPAGLLNCVYLAGRVQVSGHSPHEGTNPRIGLNDITSRIGAAWPYYPSVRPLQICGSREDLL